MNPSVETQTPPPSEKFTSAQLKEARKQFNELRELLATCSKLSQGIEDKRCDFDAILTCLYAIENHPMYKFLSVQDPSLKQVIDVTFLRLRNVGGIISLSMKHDEAESEETKKLEAQMKKLDKVIEAKGDIEGNLKRKIEEIEEEEKEAMALDEGFIEK